MFMGLPVDFEQPATGAPSTCMSTHPYISTPWTPNDSSKAVKSHSCITCVATSRSSFPANMKMALVVMAIVGVVTLANAQSKCKKCMRADVTQPEA